MMFKLKKLISSLELMHCKIDIENKVRNDMRKEMALALIDKLENRKMYTIELGELKDSVLPNGHAMRDDGRLAMRGKADLELYLILRLNEVK